MGAAVGLKVESLNVYDADFGYLGRQQVYLGADEVWDLECLFAGEDADVNVAPGGDFGVDQLFDALGEVGGHAFELKVHAGAEGVHVAAGYLGAVVAPDDSTEDVEGGMGPHQLIAAVPVYGAAQAGAGFRSGVAVEFVDVLAGVPADALDGVCGSVFVS